MPVVGDFDGDGKADIAVWRPSTGYWYIIQSSNGQVVTRQWGAGTDVPVVGDFDGDGKADIAVWRPWTGYWYIIQSSDGQVVSHQWGAPTDTPVIGDFDGDGKTDVAVWRASSGDWYIVQSSNGAVVARQWGQAGDLPVPQDYDGDGKTDLAVWRPSNGYWYVIDSSNGATLATQWGASTDVPANGSFEPEAVLVSGGGTTTGFWLPYTAIALSSDGTNGIFVVPSNHLSAAPVFVTTASASILTFAPAVTVSGNRVTGDSPARLMYLALASDGNIHLYGLDLTSTNVPVPVQIGSFSLPAGTNQLCGGSITNSAQTNLYQPSSLFVLLHLNPTSTSNINNCDVSGDVYEVVSYTDSPTTPPAVVSVTSDSFTPVYRSSGALAGLVMQQGSNLDFFADKTFTSPTVLLSNVVSSSDLIDTTTAGQHFVGDQVSFYFVTTASNSQVYRITTAAAATSIYTTASGFLSLQIDGVGDANSVFFTDSTANGLNILRAPISGGNAVSLYTEDLSAGDYTIIGSNGTQYAYVDNSNAGDAIVKTISATAPSSPAVIATYTGARVDAATLAQAAPGTLSSSQILLNFLDVPGSLKSSAVLTFGGVSTQDKLANSQLAFGSQGFYKTVYQLRDLTGIVDQGGGSVNVYTVSSASAVPLTQPGGAAYWIPSGTTIGFTPVASSASDSIEEGLTFSDTSGATATDSASHLIVPLTFADTEITPL